MENFQITGGTIVGRDHILSNKNNHDSYSWVTQDNTTIAVVCDGCGSGKHSEVGAKIGVRLLGEAIRKNLDFFHCFSENNQDTSPFWERVRKDTLASIRVLTLSLGGSFSQTVNDYFLFTIVGALITEEKTSLFSIGDGVIVLNGEMIQIGPFPGNAPPYIGYDLVESSLSDTAPELLKFTIHETLETENVESILIGTDGVTDLANIASENYPGKEKIIGPLSQFCEEDRYFKNPDMVRRSLSLMNKDSVKYIRNSENDIVNISKEHGLLHDDTTLISIRRC